MCLCPPASYSTYNPNRFVQFAESLDTKERFLSQQSEVTIANDVVTLMCFTLFYPPHVMLFTYVNVYSVKICNEFDVTLQSCCNSVVITCTRIHNKFDLQLLQVIKGYRVSRGRRACAWLATAATLGLLRLLFHWQPLLYLRAVCTSCSLGDATRVHIKVRCRRFT